MSAADLFLLTSQGKDGGWGKRGNREFQGQRHFLVQPNRKERLGIIINYFYYSVAVKRTIRGLCSLLCPILQALTPLPPPFSFFLSFFLNSGSLQSSRDLTRCLRLEVGEAQKQTVKALEWKKKKNNPPKNPTQAQREVGKTHRYTHMALGKTRWGESTRDTKPRSPPPPGSASPSPGACSCTLSK